MKLFERLEQDYVSAYKSKDQVRLNVLRLMKTAAKNLQVEKMRPLEDEDLIGLLQKQAKQRLESIEQFSSAGRRELADKEAAELAVLKSYLPEPLSAEELDALISQALTETGVDSMAGMGKVIQTVMAAGKGRADGKTVSSAVRARLQAPR